MGLVSAKALALVILPPGSILLLGFLGILVGLRWRRLGTGLVLLALAGLLVLSLPPVGRALLAGLEVHPPLEPSLLRQSRAGAIVVLGGGRRHRAPEYGADTVSCETLERLRYAARLYRATGLPVLVTGGTVYGEALSEALLMKEALVDDFRVPVQWTEERSRTTWENAQESARLLGADGVRRVLLVTHAAHMPRAIDAFQSAGLEPVPAPTGFHRPPSGERGILEWMPRASALFRSSRALHEYVGRLWYELRYRPSGSSV